MGNDWRAESETARDADFQGAINLQRSAMESKRFLQILS